MTSPGVQDMDADVLGDGATVVAIATPRGRGALALVRLSGSLARSIGERLLTPFPTAPRRAVRSVLSDGAGHRLDDVIATFFEAPHSFTGEDVLELTTHGGLLVPTSVTAALIEAGARQALPGEFTRRAVLNGKLDLLQAEAIGDLIDARSAVAQQTALRQLDGGLSRRIAALRRDVLDLEALLAYDIDFPEEDDGPVSRDQIAAAADALVGALDQLLATGDRGTLVHEGALVVLAGAPNVGKSSLFNALLGEARAIVTDVPGTTRDAIEAVLDLPGWPLRLVDTAGLRETSEVVERMGIEASTRYVTNAAVVLVCGDSQTALDEAVDAVRRVTETTVVTVATKADLVPDSHEIRADVAASAHTGAGLRDVLERIERALASKHGAPDVDAPALTQARHRVAVLRASAELHAFRLAWGAQQLPATVAATHIRAAAESLGDLIGVVQTDDILDVVFRRFCVGK